MADRDESFIDYRSRIDEVMRRTYGIDICDAGIEIEVLTVAHQDGLTPEAFVLRFGEKYDLTPLTEFATSWGRR